MDKGTWIAIIVLIIAAVGFFVVQYVAESNPPPAAATGASTPVVAQQTATPPQTPTDEASCQTFAAQTAQNDGASLTQAHFNTSEGQCYYELDSFASSGNITSINVAPSDATIASCTTTSAGSLSCQEQGSTITEPQFKTLLSNYFEN